jgi:hypothetical protein
VSGAGGAFGARSDRGRARRALASEPPVNLPPIVECQSVGELASLIAGGVEAWRTYRDRIVGS